MDTLPLLDTESLEGKLSLDAITDKTSFSDYDDRSRGKSPRRAWMLALSINIILFVASLTFLIATIYHNNILLSNPNTIWRHANSYSPIFDSVPMHLATTKMKGTLIDYTKDIFRGQPSPTVDLAWDTLTEHGFLQIPERDAIRMGWDLSITARHPDELLPDDAQGPFYAGETDMIHKLHCLNMVRKDLISNFDYYWGEMYPDRKPSERHVIHTNHCLYILLQSLLCDANTDIIPNVYMDDYHNPVPDFEIQRKCGNWQGVREWEREHSIVFNETTGKMLRKPEGHKGKSMPAEFRRLFEVGT